MKPSEIFNQTLNAANAAAEHAASSQISTLATGIVGYVNLQLRPILDRLDAIEKRLHINKRGTRAAAPGADPPPLPQISAEAPYT